MGAYHIDFRYLEWQFLLNSPLPDYVKVHCELTPDGRELKCCESPRLFGGRWFSLSPGERLTIRRVVPEGSAETLEISGGRFLSKR